MPSDLQVPFLELSRGHDSIREELDRAFSRVVDTSGFILGTEVDAFEAEFAAYCGTRHAVGVNSGTAALALLLRAAGIEPGDEIIVPAHTFIASALGVVHAGAVPVFCEVQEATGLIDPKAAEAAVTPRTAGILAVHLYGQCCDMPQLSELARHRGLALFEDAAQAHGATCHGERAGSLGRGAAFSFYPSKNLGALGDGGAITTDDDDLALTARKLRDLGQHHKGQHEIIGFNERLDGLQAAFLRVKLPHLDAWNLARRTHATTYRARLGTAVCIVTENEATPSVHHLFSIRVANRQELSARLTGAGIGFGIHYPIAVPDQPPFRSSASQEFPAARAWAAEQLSLPMFPELHPGEVARVADVVLGGLKG